MGRASSPEPSRRWTLEPRQAAPCCTPDVADLRALIRSDLDRYLFNTERAYSPLAAVVTFATQPGLLATAHYRFGHWAQKQQGLKGTMSRALHLLARRPIEVLTGISILPTAHVGRGLYIAHFGGVVIGPCIIGDNCNLGHDTLIGTGGRGERRGAPKLGDRVNVTCGGRVVGPVHVGDDVMIGLNAVVTKDVPARAVVAAPTSMVISHRGSFDYLDYSDCESDPARCASARLALDSLNDGSSDGNPSDMSAGAKDPSGSR